MRDSRAEYPSGRIKNNMAVGSACVLASAAVMAIDMIVPLGVATGVLYVVVVLLALQSRNRALVLAVAVGTTVLTGIGFALSAPLGVAWQVLVNRGLALAMICRQ